MSFDEIEQWEKESDTVLFFDNEKAIAFQKAKDDDESNPALVVMVGDDSKENTIVLIDKQFKRLTDFLSGQ